MHPHTFLSQVAGPVVLGNDGRLLDFADEDGINLVVQSGPGFLAVRPPGPTGPLDLWEHCEQGQTPLSRAVSNRHEGVVSIVPPRDDISSAKTDEWSEPLLGLSAEHRSEATASALPQRNDINPDKANKPSPTPFFRALKNLYKRAPKQLR